MAIIPGEPIPGPGQAPDLPPPGTPAPPVQEPEPDLPGEDPVPNPDENDNPPKHIKA